jgi:hypothetical protein
MELEHARQEVAWLMVQNLLINATKEDFLCQIEVEPSQG